MEEKRKWASQIEAVGLAMDGVQSQNHRCHEEGASSAYGCAKGLQALVERNPVLESEKGIS